MMKKETTKWIVQILISILTAIATALGTTSCVNQISSATPSYESPSSVIMH